MFRFIQLLGLLLAGSALALPAHATCTPKEDCSSGTCHTIQLCENADASTPAVPKVPVVAAPAMPEPVRAALARQRQH